MNDTAYCKHLELGQKLSQEILAPMKQAFVGKDEIIDGCKRSESLI